MTHKTRRNYKSSRSKSRVGRSRLSRTSRSIRTSSKGVVNDFAKREEERLKHDEERLKREEVRRKLERLRRARELRMIYRRLATDIRFRSTEDINNMLTERTLGGKPVKMFIISSHGSISRKKVFRIPSYTAVFDLAENEYRGHKTCSSLESSFFDIMIGLHGTHIGNFFNAMLGGEFAPNPTSKLIPQIAYRTPGELAFDIQLSIQDGESENFDNALGCWDITDAIDTFNPMDFSRFYKGVYMDPNTSRQLDRPGATPYKPEVEIRDMMRRTERAHLSEVIQTLERKYPKTVCFIIVSCCMGLGSPEEPDDTEYPVQPPAYTHYALKGEAEGDPEVDLIRSMVDRELSRYPIEYPNGNKSVYL